MKSQVEKITPYLPYSVGVINSVGKRSELTFNDYAYDLEKGFKLILRPLEDTKTLEIDFDGEKGLFSDNFFGFVSFEYYYNEYLKYGRAYWYNIAPYVVVQRLLENHFDVFGMIEDGYAVDINEVSVSKYKKHS